MNTHFRDFVLAGFFASTLHAEVRTFTSAAGTTLKGELVSVIGDTVTIKKEDGSPLALKISAFSRVDQAWLLTQAQAAVASDPSKATKDAPFVNSLGMKFVPVPGTSVLFCTHITRRADYAAYAGAAPNVDTAWQTHPKDNNGGPFAQGDDYPVVGVSWNDAQAFCAWLSQKEGRVYRLPTDREWSFAVGIGPQEESIRKDATPESLSGKVNGYPWGAQWPPPKGAGNFDDTSHSAMFPQLNKGIPGYVDGYPLTSPVFAFQPNKLGIHDLSGNITQWCQDWYDKAQTQRLRRGIDYQSGPQRGGYESSQRWGSRPEGRLYMDIGFASFRCVIAMGGTAP